MLDDRPYMRQVSVRVPIQASVILMIVLVVAFALQCINDVYIKSIGATWLAVKVAPIACA